jgi:hypothetical protein
MLNNLDFARCLMVYNVSMKESYQIGGLEKIDIDIIHAEAEKLLKNSSVKEINFVDPDGPYSQESVDRDLALVKKREEEWRRKDSPEAVANKKIATIFEAIIFQHAELSEWLGDQAFSIKTSLYDDYENGVDAVMEFRDPESSAYLGMAMDVTFSSDPNSSGGITKKFDRIFSRIEKGTLTRIKYFHAKNRNINIHGQLNDVPEVVIGADKATVLELAELWKGKKNEMLGSHKIQIMMLLQIQAQLRVFAAYANREGNASMAQIFQDRLLIIEGILAKKKALADKVGATLSDDRVHYALMNFLKYKEIEVSGGKGAV